MFEPRQGEGCLSRPSLERSDVTEKFQFRESPTETEPINTPDQIAVLSEARIIIYINILSKICTKMLQ